MSSRRPNLVDLFMGELFNFASRHPPRKRMTGFNRESIRNLEVVDRLIPSSTLYFFYDFAFEGVLPNGEKTSLPLIRDDEVPLWGKPYAEWAPWPYNQSPGSVTDKMLDCPAHFQVKVDRRISCMRARLWQGLVPMSGGRWKEKRLDDPTNWQFAFEFMFDIIYTFMWLGDPDIQKPLKDNFNYVADQLGGFQHAINARRAQNGVTEKIDLKALWLEYMHAVFEAMVTRTHSWFADRVNEIVMEKGKARYDAIADANGAANSYDAAKKFLESWADLNKLLCKAEWMVMMPMDGFTGFPSSSVPGSKVVGSMFPMPFRQDEYNEMSSQMPWPVSTRLEHNTDDVYTNRESIDALLKETQETRGQLRRQMRGEPKKLGSEHWIWIIKSRQAWSLSHGGPQDQRWGFVAYKLTDKPTKEQWDSFLEKVNADFAKSGEWVDGFEDVKKDMALQWIDGREVGIPDNDIQAAKRHFQRFSISPACRRRAWKMDFFIVDEECFDSYMSPPTLLQEREPYGDHGGYLKLIDTATYNPQLIAETAPGYKNELKVLGSLVFDDIYPLIVSLSQRTMDLWPYAMGHPNQVYVGPPVLKQEKEWENIWKVRELYWRVFWKWRSEQSGQATSSSASR